MNLILNLKLLWRRRALVALAIGAAAAISILVVFQVSLLPPSISKRSQVQAKGSIEILVDSDRSPIADARRDLTGLIARAGVFARYIAGGNVIGQIAKANGIPVKQIDVAGPAPLPGEAPGADEAPSYHPYGIAITQPDELLPILSVATRAPTVREARGLAAAAPAAIQKEVTSIQAQQNTLPGKRVQFRVLGPARAAPVDDAWGKKIALVLFVVLLAVFIVLIMGVPPLVAAWRAAELNTDLRDVSQPPDLVPLPAGRGNGHGGDAEASLDRTAGET